MPPYWVSGTAAVLHLGRPGPLLCCHLGRLGLLLCRNGGHGHLRQCRLSCGRCLPRRLEQQSGSAAAGAHRRCCRRCTRAGVGVQRRPQAQTLVREVHERVNCLPPLARRHPLPPQNGHFWVMPHALWTGPLISLYLSPPVSPSPFCCWDGLCGHFGTSCHTSFTRLCCYAGCQLWGMPLRLARVRSAGPWTAVAPRWPRRWRWPSRRCARRGG